MEQHYVFALFLKNSIYRYNTILPLCRDTIVSPEP